MNTFTQEELDNFARYENMRSSGLFSMFDPRARDMSDLTEAEYVFVLQNYTYLKAAYREKKQ